MPTRSTTLLPNGHIKCPRFYPKKRVLLNGLRPAVRSLKRSLKNEDVPPMRYGRDTSGRTERDERTPCRRPTARALSAAFLQEIRKKASAPNGLAGSTPARGNTGYFPHGGIGYGTGLAMDIFCRL